jgi:hypothetical protein
MACVRYNLEQEVFVYDCYVKEKDLIQIMQEKNYFSLNFPTQHVHLEIQFPN